MSADQFDSSAFAALEVGFAVHEIAPMKHFYCDGLGFRPYGVVDLDEAHIAAFRFGNCVLKLTFFLNEDRRPAGPHAVANNSYITLRVRSIHTSVPACLAAGGHLLIPITSTKTKAGQVVQFAFVADPMGNKVELVEGDPWSFHDV